jgi:hypothetical protein
MPRGIVGGMGAGTIGRESKVWQNGWQNEEHLN